MTNSVPSVSVVLPTIRLDPWLDQAVESVLSQEGINLQLIVILDGVDRQDHRMWMDDSRVRVLKNANRMGVGETLRRAMQAVDKEFVARLDADDVALPKRLFMQAEYLESHPDTVAVSVGTETVNGAGLSTGRFNFKPGPDVRRQLLLQNVIVQSAVMFRLQAYNSVGGYHPLVQMEDYHLWLRLAQRGKIALLPETLAQYRIHTGQLSLGAKPFGEHIGLVLRERRNLSKVLHCWPPTTWVRDAIWASWQFFRFYVLNPVKKTRRWTTER